MSLSRGSKVYEGKAKALYEVQGGPVGEELIWIQYKDDLTAFNAQKRGSFARKGAINGRICELIFEYLKENGVSHHGFQKVSETEWVVRRLKMVPLEFVIRNRVAGSFAQRLKRPEGENLPRPILELYYKDDSLGDPFINDETALYLSCVTTQAQLEQLKESTRAVNRHLRHLFAQVGLDLVDFKIEWGIDKHGHIVLADEISPDSCRLWDQQSGERKDKDRFRRDLGQVEEAYQDVLNRLEYWMKERK